MKTEPEKLLDRAEDRLRNLSQTSREESLKLLRGFLKMESHRLRMLHRFGLGGLEIALGRAQVVDALITHLYWLVFERYCNQTSIEGQNPSRVAVAAVGGYGRGELCPHSDVDLLILYDRSSVDFARFLAGEMIYLLWDVGLKVGHSWRTPEECLEMARIDSTVENSLLDARQLVGGLPVWENLRSLLHKHWKRNSQKFVERTRAEVAERYYGKLGETVFLQEPNLKESPGGLRDFHTMLWLARGGWLLENGEGLVPSGILSGSDWNRAQRGYDWMMRVRNELHYLTGRRADQLTLTLQPEVAFNLKYHPDRHLLAGEVFMREYYLHAENVHRVMRLVLAAALRQKGKRPRQVSLKTPLDFPLVQAEGELRLRETEPNRFPSSALDMMKVLSLAQELDLGVGEDIKHAVRNHLAMLRRDWQRSPEMSREFLEILRRPGKVGMALRSMHSCGLLGKYLPEFGHVTRLMQSDSVHRYTTDEHTLRGIEFLDAIWNKPPTSMQRYRDLTYHISDPAPLYLGLLLHDVGKGLGGGHSEKGALKAAAVCERLGLSERQTYQVDVMVRHHLVLSHLYQRRDLSDRKVAQGAADVVGDLETLSMLCLLTYADTAAVAPEVWTEWKNALLWELYSKVHDELLGLETATSKEEVRLVEVRRRVQELLQSVTANGTDRTALSPEAARELMEEHLSLLPPRYSLGHRPELIAKQILLAKRAAETGPAVDVIPVPQEGYTLLLLCCPDTPGLFARAAGTLAALEVNIMGARLDTRKDGMAVDVLWISTPQRNVISDPVHLRRIGNTVEGVLKETEDFENLVKRIEAQPAAPVRKSPQISLNNEISESSTVLEVMAEDRLGFAYSIAKCLTGIGLNIAFAKLSTEKTMVFDVFYLTDSAGRKIPETDWGPVITNIATALQIPAVPIHN